MSWEAFLPANVASRPSNFLGPNIAGTIVQALETGIILNQSVRFWSRASDEPRIIRIMVAFLTCIALFQTSIAIYNSWRIVVFNFGDWVTVVNLQWPDRIQPTLNALMSAPVQAFLIWRCWTALHRRPWVLISLGLLLSACIVVNIVITVDIFKYKSGKINIESLRHMTLPPRDYMTAFVLTAVLDIAITILMLCILIRAKSQVVSRRFDKIVGRLLIMLWESALPPTACAIAACAVYISMSLENLWDVFLQCILGKLYVISVFVILNGRADLKEFSSSSSRMRAQSPGLSQHWVSRAEGRIHLTTILDRIDTPDSSTNHSDVELTPTTILSSHHRFAASQDSARATAGKERKIRRSTSFLPEMRKILDSGSAIDLETGFYSRSWNDLLANPDSTPRDVQRPEHINAASGTASEGRPP